MERPTNKVEQHFFKPGVGLKAPHKLKNEGLDGYLDKKLIDSQLVDMWL